MSGGPAEVEELVVARRSSVSSQVIVASFLIAALVVGAQWVGSRGDGDPGGVPETAEVPTSTTTFTTTTSSTTTQPPQSSAPAALGNSLEFTINADASELALGAPEGTRVAYGIIDGGLRVVDLSNGASFDIAAILPLGMTTNYLVATQLSPRLPHNENTTLVIVDLDTLDVAILETSKFVDGIVATGGPNRVWLLNSENQGPFTYQLLDLRNGGTLLDTLDVPAWTQIVPAGERDAPFINVLTNGVYEIEGAVAAFLGRGTVIAASAGGAIWSTCDDTLACTTQLVTHNSSTPLLIDDDVLFNDPIINISPDGKFVAIVAQNSDGVSVIDTESGISTQYEIGHVWSKDGLMFLDHRLLVWSEAALKLIDVETGDVTYLGIIPNHEYLVSSQ